MSESEAHIGSMLTFTSKSARWRWLWPAAALLPLVALPSLTPQRASASGGGDGCNPGRANNYLTYYFDGMTRKLSSDISGGVQANILNYSPDVPLTTDVSAAWVMLTEPTFKNYAQVGWIEAPRAKRNTFVEYTIDNGSNFSEVTYPSHPINSAPNYKVDYDPNAGNFTFVVDGSKLSAESSSNFAPSVGEIYAEIHTKAAQMPGGFDNTENFSDAEIYHPAGTAGQWTNFSGTTQTSTGRNGAAGPDWAGESPVSGSTGVNNFSTWDTACQE